MPVEQLPAQPATLFFAKPATTIIPSPGIIIFCRFFLIGKKN